MMSRIWLEGKKWYCEEVLDLSCICVIVLEEHSEVKIILRADIFLNWPHSLFRLYKVIYAEGRGKSVCV